MALVTDAEVKAFVDTERDTTPFITMADLIVTENLAGQSYSAARLKQIELLLAAHFTVLVEEKDGLQRSKVGQSEEAYQRRDQKAQNVGFGATRFGEQAMMLDTSGILGNMLLSQQTLKGLFTVV